MAHRYFLDETDGITALVRGQEAVHMARVMRAKPGDRFTLTDGKGNDYLAQVTGLSDGEVILQILEKTDNPADPKRKLDVFMALPKGDKMEMIVQKCCELGASAVIPFESRYCVAQKSKRDASKRARFQKISDEACKQSGRSVPMAVEETLTFPQMLSRIGGYGTAVLFYEHGEERLTDVPLKEGAVAVIIGSEGGFSEEEVERMKAEGARSVVLGRRILRCETAAIAATAMTMLLMGEME